MSIVWLDGEYLPADRARVSVFDRGFLFADSVYEVIPVYGGHPFRLAEHLARLDHSLAGIALANPLPHATWREIIGTVAARNGGGDLSVYLQVTRGAAGKRDHCFPEGVRPTVFVMATPLAPVPAELLEQGASVITREDLRWRRCDIKATALLPNVLMRQQAQEAGAHEALLVRDGEVTEGSASNVFIVEPDGLLVTPPKGPFILPGITRDLVLELARTDGIASCERSIALAGLSRAREVWITSSTREVLAVTRLDGNPVGDGRPGPVWQRMWRLYQDYKQRLRTGAAA